LTDPGSDLPDGPPPRRPGTATFTIEGRRAPGLFVVGWLATIVGAGLVAIALFSASGPAGAAMLIAGLAILALGLVAGAGSQAIERAARATAAYRGPSPFLVLAAAIPITLVLGALIGLPLIALGLPVDSPLATLVSLLITASAYLGLVRLLVVGTGSLGWAEMGVHRPRREDGPALAYGAVLGVGLVFVSGFLALALSSVLAQPEAPLPPAGGLAGGLVNLVSAALIAPVAEEVFFRGFSTTAWLRDLGERSAIVRGALFFAAVHILGVTGATFSEGAERALFAFLVRLPVALALGWVFVRRGSLPAAIGLHAAFNGLPVLLQLLAA